MSKNLRILGDYSARMTSGDYSAVYEVFAPEFFSHVTPRVSPAAVGTDIRPQEEKFWESAKAAFSDMQFSVGLLIEHDDLIVSNWTLTGVHDGAAYYGVPPSGKRVEINGTAILRMRDGKVVEHWGGPHCMNGIGLSTHTDAHSEAAHSERVRATA
jgi:SnoaL-like polyketide cyclase